jgi:CheY-like chemotaxis protein
VDDNDFNLFTFREIMETTHKIPSDGAVNGLDAVTKFEKSLSCCPYRVVFMDVNMPVMNGIEAT